MSTAIKKLVDHFEDQVKTAKALGVSQSAVSQWITGASRMSALVALRAEKQTDGKFKAVDLCPEICSEAATS